MTNRGNPLTPYIPRLVIEWLRDEPTAPRRSLAGSVAFADISGFTRLTELLARRGKAGAEEMGDILNAVFEELLGAAYQHQAALLKWGGDAVLLLFDTPDHAERAAAAAVAMQRTIRSVGRLRTTAGPVRLQMSIGIHTGQLDVLLVGRHHRELVVTGPSASTVAAMEKVADAGEVVLSPTAAAAIRAAGGTTGIPKGPGVLLEHPPPGLVPLPVLPVPEGTGVDLGTAMPAQLRDHLEAGQVDHEHRHVAVGFVEFSGADSLAVDPDPDVLTAAVEHLITSCQEAAEANDVLILGTDVNHDGGKVILISGAPRRKGDDEARVLTAVRTVLDSGGPLALRGGVTAGRVFAGDFGPPYRRTYSVAGDCVNLAARLMASAGPGQLLATVEVVEQAGGRFDVTEVPPFTVKGKQAPIAARRVDAIRTTRARAADGVPFVGRRTELQVLLDALDAAQRGSGRTVDLVGPAGIGKSRLVEELAGSTGMPTLWVDGDVYGASMPYQPIRRFVRAQLGLAPTADRPSVGSALAELVKRRAPAMTPWLPLVGAVVDADVPMTQEVADLDLRARKERMEWATSELLGALVTEPTILVFNDSHLMDDATIDLLRRLAADVGDRPWLLVTTYRPDERAEVHEGTTVLELVPLDDEDADELLTTMTRDTPIPTHRLQALAERARGNPLYLRELAATARESSTTELPNSIEGVISARIDRLSPAGRRTLRAAAVLGMVVHLGLLEDVLRRDGAFDPSAVDELRRLDEFLEPLDGQRLEFRHHLVREAAYEGLPYRRRQKLHADTAATLQAQAGSAAEDRADLLSLHCFHGGRHEDAWRWSVVAADRARAQYANAEAAECYRRALTSAERLGDPALATSDVAEALGDVCFELGEFDAAESALRRALRDASAAPEVRARRCGKVAQVRETTGRYPAALRWLTKGRQAIDGATSEAARLALGQLLVGHARVRHFQGRNGEARRRAAEALDLAERTGDQRTLAQALEYLDLADTALGRVDGAARSMRSLEIYEALGDLSGQGRIHNSLGVRAYFRGRWPEAIDHYAQAADAYERAGRAWIAAVSRANGAEVLSDQGHLDAAHQILEASMRVWRGIGADSELAFGTYQLGRIAARSGRLDKALDAFGRARAFCAEAGETVEVVLIDAYAAEAHLLGGHHEEAAALAGEVLAAARAMEGDGAPLALALRVRAEAFLAQGHEAEGAALLRESLDAARRRDALHDVALGLDLLVSAGLGSTTTETERWQAERDELWTRLGMAPQGHPQLHARAAPDEPAVRGTASGSPSGHQPERGSP